MEPVLLLVVLGLALVFAWTNGFHDASNAVSAALATGALTPRVALPLAAALNVVGALLGLEVATTVGASLVTTPVSQAGLKLLLAALVAAITWNLVTWWWGMPSSSSHALIGALAGAGLAAGATVDWDAMGTKVVLPLVVSPLVGLVGAWLLTKTLQAVFTGVGHAAASRGFRAAQSVSSSAMALGHGLQDGQKSLGVMLAATTAAHGVVSSSALMSMRVGVALAIGAGTACAGWRIVRTLAAKVAPIDPVTGFSAEAVSSTVLYATAGVYGVPISSTQAFTAAVLGAGATRGLRTVRWRAVRAIAVTWLATPLASGVLAAVVLLVLGGAA